MGFCHLSGPKNATGNNNGGMLSRQSVFSPTAVFGMFQGTPSNSKQAERNRSKVPLQTAQHSCNPSFLKHSGQNERIIPKNLKWQLSCADRINRKMFANESVF